MKRIKNIENMQEEQLYEEIVTYFQLYILLYADDTIIMIILAENPNDLQALLDEIQKILWFFRPVHQCE